MFKGTGYKLLLYDLQSPVNIGQILRTGEQFHIDVIVYDPRDIFSDPTKRRTISDFSCGALSRHPPKLIPDYSVFRAMHDGRLVATCLRPDAMLLNNFYFRRQDTIILGNEYDGLPASVIDAADASLYIPLPKAELPKPASFSAIDPARSAAVAQNGVPNLNVAMTASIISYTSYLQSSFAPFGSHLNG
jgi:tRNA G18 (ribose-2'-O)-methylase SpoU